MNFLRELKKERIAVLAGGTSCEREISLISGRNVLEALVAQGLSPVWVDPAHPNDGVTVTMGGADDPYGFFSHLKREGVTLAFIALHGTFGEDGTVQRLLEKEGILYTGPGVLASQQAFDKSLSQTIFREKGVRVPTFFTYKTIEEARRRPPLALPLVVKPAKSGSSVGVTIVSEKSAYGPALVDAFNHSDVILVEQFIPGRELTVGFLGEEPLPIVEVIVSREFYDYEAKYRDAGTRYDVPAKLTGNERRLVNQEAVKAYRALGCERLARVDLILGTDGHAYVLEVNTIPGLTAKSLLPKAAKEAGIDFGALCVRILAMALADKRMAKTHG